MGVDHVGEPGLRQEIQALWRALRRVGKAALQNAAIGRAGIRVYEGGSIRFEDGGGIVIVGSGYITIDGNLTGAGSFEWSGPWDLSGTGTITGNVTSTGTFTQNGPWNLNGLGKIAGNTNLTGNMTVASGGKITVQGAGGNVVLDSTFSSPRIGLGPAQIDGSASSFTFTAGTQIVYFADNTIRVPAMATKAASSVPGGFVGAVHADTTGKFFRLI